MKFVGVTMRVDIANEVNEHRDVIDQSWYKFLKKCGLLPVLLPNFIDMVKFIDSFNLSGIILTGGNSIGVLGGDALERDDFETAIINYAIEHNLPIIGICRGMQIIQSYFGVKLEEVHSHVATRHAINYAGRTIIVNSYHKYGAYNSIAPLAVEAQSEKGVIEATFHYDLPIKGIMWHPEREEVFSSIDLEIFRKHFVT